MVGNKYCSKMRTMKSRICLFFNYIGYYLHGSQEILVLIADAFKAHYNELHYNKKLVTRITTF